MSGKTKVLVVDDSSFAVAAISRKLQTDSSLEVIGSAHNGIEALNGVKSLHPDVVTMDIAMPEMDGLTALGHIMNECPVPVVMVSALTTANADLTIRALESGAVDFLLKSSVLHASQDDGFTGTLIDKVKNAAKTGINRKTTVSNISSCFKNKASQKTQEMTKVIIIGSSTGGPRALLKIISCIPGDIRASFLIVQHMPPVFTKSLAERLNQAAQLDVREAANGDMIQPGRVLVAPGDYHMLVTENNSIMLDQGPPVLGVRPAIDITMKSVAAIYGAATVGVVLTGMNTDGTIGASYIKKAGGIILAQDEATSVVYGMPASVAKAGYVNKVLPLENIAEEIIKLCAKVKA